MYRDLNAWKWTHGGGSVKKTRHHTSGGWYPPLSRHPQSWAKALLTPGGGHLAFTVVDRERLHCTRVSFTTLAISHVQHVDRGWGQPSCMKDKQLTAKIVYDQVRGSTHKLHDQPTATQYCNTSLTAVRGTPPCPSCPVLDQRAATRLSSHSHAHADFFQQTGLGGGARKRTRQRTAHNSSSEGRKDTLVYGFITQCARERACERLACRFRKQAELVGTRDTPRTTNTHRGTLTLDFDRGNRPNPAGHKLPIILSCRAQRGGVVTAQQPPQVL